MTSDKQTHGHLAKPFTPTLSAAFNRTSKPPLTPKLASPGSGYSVPRRLAPPDHPYPTPTKDDVSATPASYLSANVTPRSGSRTTRRDAAFPSPTHSVSGQSSTASYSQIPVGLGVNGVRRTERSPARGIKPSESSRSLRGKALNAEAQHTPRTHPAIDPPSNSPMFFHASAVRSTPSSEVEVPSRLKQGRSSPASSFVYANGDQEKHEATDDTQSTVSSLRRRSGGFARSGLPPRTAPPSSARLKSPRISDASSYPPEDGISRGGPAADLPLPVEVVMQRLGSSSSQAPERPPLLPLRQHRKSSSVDSTSQISTPSDGLRASPFIVSTTLSTDGVPATISERMPTLRPRIFSNGSSVTTSPLPMSPGKHDNSFDPASTARTERKIMDLEISNSSLLAINRTLEREMRKHTAELRRYRRLSRSGRLSMAPSTRSFSGAALSTTSEMEEEDSEISFAHSQDEVSDLSDEDSVPDEGVLSPDSLAEHDAKHRAHDEKKFMLDLARHQELLIDSQKLNQSIKRCLGWTEELIKEGRKALEYNVRVQDVELGGRVLSPEELGDVGESGRGLLSPSADCSTIFTSDSSAFEHSYFEASSLPLPSSPGGSD
ncbi:hypothetical protein POX_b01965 [Penicillium oxalicum]|uniref:Uncharacterized protein n=1 Tax=Penicillium oxalicum (strain 114-2 / CGMCC 5302) TaxID=933388 RepID=S7ZL47_PENO1|nr:hypothetical protein POX_b01965 [Penicillium oxalicum]EPS31049.1 hypothetical protein PDE_06003 [Penicillium oxalicum 114-2]KAI2791936.1 hypothetical protein POX_b01965 [Penicillium oxalicum]